MGLALAAAVVCTGALAYWLLVTSEGVYLGRRVVIALYDRYAAMYDEIKGVMPHEDAHHLALPLLESVRDCTDPLVLDVATGTARLPLALLRQWEFAGKVIGLDLSAGMLSVARRRTLRQQDRIGLVRQDATILPFASRRFGAVTCLEAFEFLPDQRRALGEMVRVLKPGGMLLLTNRIGVDAWFLPGRSLTSARMEEILRALGLVDVGTRRWQVHYDLVQGVKPALGSEQGL